MKSITALVRATVGTIGAWWIYKLIWIFGRAHQPSELPWLMGPLGGLHIGDTPYEETAAKEGLSLERDATSGGLIPSLDALAGDCFDPALVDARIRFFYEQTAGHRLDTWATTFFPASVALWLLVQTISRRVDQLNFPLESLDTAYGMTSEIVLLKHPDGRIKYTGWFRRLVKTGRSIYTGFYMSEVIPAQASPCVKVVFPMPEGNATVILRPENDTDGGLRLESKGSAFGDVGFYRVQAASKGRVRVWRIRSLVERFRLYVDDFGALRCDHTVRFLGLPVLSLHYKISPPAK